MESVALDLWTRATILWRLRNDEPRRIETMNRIIRMWGRHAFGIARRVLHLELVVEGEPPREGRYLVVSNHQSSVDIATLFTVFDALNLKFVAMRQLSRGAPAVSAALRSGGFVFVGGRGRAADVAALTRFSQNLERWDGSAVIFPEGGRTQDGSLRRFASAGIRIIRRTARLPVLPVTIDGLWRAPTVRDARHLVGGRVTVRIGAPIPFDAGENSRELTDRIERTIREHLESIRAAPHSVEGVGPFG